MIYEYLCLSWNLPLPSAFLFHFLFLVIVDKVYLLGLWLLEKANMEWEVINGSSDWSGERVFLET